VWLANTLACVPALCSEPELALLLPWLPNFTRDIEDAITLYLWTCCRGAEIVGMQRVEITRGRRPVVDDSA
jgi:hypothetical protein